MKKAKDPNKYVPPATVRMWARFSGLSLVSAAAMAYFAITESSGFDDVVAYLVLTALLVLAFFGCRKLSKKANFKGLKKHYIGKGVDKLVQQDTGDMSFSLQVYNSLPSKYMLKWISELNPEAGKVIADQVGKK